MRAAAPLSRDMVYGSPDGLLEANSDGFLVPSASAPLIGPPSGPGSVRFPPRPPTNAPTCGAPVFYDPPPNAVYPKVANTIFIGPQEGPGAANIPPQRVPLNMKTAAPDVMYSLPPVDTVKPRTSYQISFKGALLKDPPSMTQKSYANYDGELTHPDLYKPTTNRKMSFGKAPQRVDPANNKLTQICFLSHRPCTPAAYKHTRMPARRFGPGPGLSIDPRFRSMPDLTKESFMKNGSPSVEAIKPRNQRAIITGSVRSTIMDARMELLSLNSIMRF